MKLSRNQITSSQDMLVFFDNNTPWRCFHHQRSRNHILCVRTIRRLIYLWLLEVEFSLKCQRCNYDEMLYRSSYWFWNWNEKLNIVDIVEEYRVCQ